MQPSSRPRSQPGEKCGLDLLSYRGRAVAPVRALHPAGQCASRDGGGSTARRRSRCFCNANSTTYRLRPSPPTFANGRRCRRCRSSPEPKRLAEYQQITGLDDVEATFEGRNPLPALVVITPRDAVTDRAALLALRGRVSAPAEVDSVELDLLWVDRLATNHRGAAPTRRSAHRDARAGDIAHRGEHHPPRYREATRGNRDHATVRRHGCVHTPGRTCISGCGMV